MLDVRVDQRGTVTICRPEGELDAYSVPSFREKLGHITAKGNLVIDLSAVPFMDSSGLGALIGGIRKTREAGGDVAVACNQPTLIQLLETTGFVRIVEVCHDVDAAIEVLGTKRR